MSISWRLLFGPLLFASHAVTRQGSAVPALRTLLVSVSKACFYLLPHMTYDYQSNAVLQNTVC